MLDIYTQTTPIPVYTVYLNEDLNIYKRDHIKSGNCIECYIIDLTSINNFPMLLSPVHKVLCSYI